MATPKSVPVQMPNGGWTPHGIHMRIPWRIHEKAWQTYAKHYSGQSAERLAERGGFGLVELVYLLAGEDPFAVDPTDETMLTNFFGEWEKR